MEGETSTPININRSEEHFQDTECQCTPLDLRKSFTNSVMKESTKSHGDSEVKRVRDNCDELKSSMIQLLSEVYAPSACPCQWFE